MDHARDLGLAGTRLPRQENAHVERRDQRDLTQQYRERIAPSDDVVETKRGPRRPRRVARLLAHEETVGERRQLTRKELGDVAVTVGERECTRGSLQVEHADRRILSDRRAEHRLDALQAHAFARLEPAVEQGRRRDDGRAERR